MNNESLNQMPSSLITFLLHLQCQGRGCGWLGPGLHQSVEAGLAAEERLVAGDLGPDKDTRGRVERPEADLANVNVSQDTAAPQQHQLQQQHWSGHMLLVSTFSELPFPDFLVLWRGEVFELLRGFFLYIHNILLSISFSAGKLPFKFKINSYK